MNGHQESLSHYPEWLFVVGLFGTKALVKEARKLIKKTLKENASRIFFINANTFHFYASLLQRLPLPKKIKLTLDNLALTMKLFLGIPSTTALPIAYVGSGTQPEDRSLMDPGADGCGIIWFAPLVPMEARLALTYTNLCIDTLKKYNLPPFVSLTSINERCFDSPLAIVFNKDDPDSTRRAKECYGELWEECKKHGIIPYRIPIDEQWRITESGTPFWDIAKKIKDALDPNNIISPGRYSKK